MSRVDDLIDLIQTTNEVYLINPSHNVRSAYIQIDDLCELAMKSWLQLDTIERQQNCQGDLETRGLANTDRHFSHLRRFFRREIDQTALAQGLGIAPNSAPEVTLNNIFNTHQWIVDWEPIDSNSGRFKWFHEIVQEVKDRFPLPAGQGLHDLLDRVQDRRENRNKFFHDHQQAGLTVQEEQCLAAFEDLYSLMGYLFTDTIEVLDPTTGQLVQKQVSVLESRVTSVLRAHIAAIRARRKCIRDPALIRRYNEICATWENDEGGDSGRKLRKRGEVAIAFPNPGYEYSVIQYYSTPFYDALLQAGLIP